MEKRETCVHMGIQIPVPTMENSMEIPQKFKQELPYDPATSLLGIIHPTKMKTRS